MVGRLAARDVALSYAGELVVGRSGGGFCVEGGGGRSRVEEDRWGRRRSVEGWRFGAGSLPSGASFGFDLPPATVLL